jgi:protein involved in polysaccharide export with SLBB domain
MVRKPLIPNIPLVSALVVALLFGAMPCVSAQAPAQQPTARSDDSPAPSAPTRSRGGAAVSDDGFSRQVISSAESDYVLSPGDIVELSIFHEPDLASHSSIARDGTVQLPLLREVKLAGMTVRDARDMLAKLYGQKYLVNPQVYLNVVQFAQRKFTIMGQVGKPGSYDLQGGQTIDLLEAIGMAGGFTRIADRGRVLIRRKTSNGGSEILKANVKRMTEGKLEVLQVKPGDVITVGESWY